MNLCSAAVLRSMNSHAPCPRRGRQSWPLLGEFFFFFVVVLAIILVAVITATVASVLVLATDRVVEEELRKNQRLASSRLVP